MSIIISEINEEIGIITEASSDGKPKNYFIEGVYMQSEVLNKNNRRYSKKILEREANNYNEKYIKQNRAFGELSHPDSIQVNPERVSHFIKSLVQEGNNFVGRAKVMDTPCGKIVKNFIDEDAKIGVSSRGFGTMKTANGIIEIQEDYRLVTPADIVLDPSAPLAFVNAVLENEKSWMNLTDDIFINEDMELLREELKKMNKRQIEENALIKFKQLLTKFSKSYNQ